MQIERITSSNENLFFSYVKDKELEFFFYIMDYKQYPEKTQLFIAKNSDNEIEGLFIIWQEHTIQCRGSEAAARTFIKYLKQTKVDIHQITGTLEHQFLLNECFPNPKMKFNLFRMTLRKGQEKLDEKYKIVELNETHKEPIAALLRKSDPVYFGDQTADRIMMDENRPFFAIMDGDKMTSISGLWIDESMGIINLIATDPNYRRQQRATSIVSSSVSWLFKKTDKILIHVRSENFPAINTYKKVGYQIAFEYIVMTVK
ncbi:hypothetical protein NEF87_004942 [Candidatus Lokiarchaeum ossiferum]|uniref:N-acetyltransferase domain-containing protein n=1 Tax=Candidatus Lokiarchaeum ossiferum TaxID=2951803 RepID=A0ABY6I0K9_9ARCH|nr:hypothetical protein NEF87_004942 [Candidatus Lokiarchaeum sp. B-35]